MGNPFKPQKIVATIEIEYRINFRANVSDVDAFVKSKVNNLFIEDLVSMQEFNQDVHEFMQSKVARIRVEDDIDD